MTHTHAGLWQQLYHAFLLKMKTKKCKVCKNIFLKERAIQIVCSEACALIWAKNQRLKEAQYRAKQENKERKKKLEALRTKPQLTKLAQIAFNRFIRARDAGKECISCGRPLGDKPNSYDCGHYRSIGSAPHMRFVEDNAHGQCKYCNRHLNGNHIEFRKGLLKRIGERTVQLIESDEEVRKYTREGLIEIARHYREEARKILEKNHKKVKKLYNF